MADTKTLAELVAEVSAKLQRIEKKGTAPQAMGGFPFVRSVDVMDALKPELDARGIILRPLYRALGEPLIRERDRGYTMVLTVELELWALRGGDELLLARTIGMGADTQDKASGKAQTSALKEAILKTFAIPTGDDPEASEQHESMPRQRPQQTRATQPTSNGSKSEDVAALNALLKQVDELESQTLNRYSVRAHVRRETKLDSIGELIAKGTDAQRSELIAYLTDKLRNPDAGPTRAEAMSDDEALAAGAALVQS